MEDDSCRRAGAIPFKWEVCPGTPKHTRSASAVPSSVSAKVAPPKLTPPPSMASSPTPYYYRHYYSASSPRVSSARSASVSPSRRRPYGYGGAHRRAPTAFIDAAPRAMTTTEYAAAAATEAAGATAPASAFGCFSLTMLRRKGSKRGGGSGGGSGSGSSSSSSVSSFRSDGGLGLGLRRSVSISSSSSSLPLPPGRRFAEARQEVEAATGSGWFF